MERIAIDVLGPLPMTEAGNKYILIIANYFTKWVEAFPLPNQEAKTVADKLINEVICRFGVPLIIHSDQGRNFESALFAEVCQLLDIQKTPTTPYHPQSDGMAWLSGTIAHWRCNYQSSLTTIRKIGTFIFPCS